MWVRLRTFGYNATLRSVIMDPAIYDALRVEVRQPSKNIHLVNAPYAAWQFAYWQMFEASVGPRGGKKPWGEKANFTALRTITKELNYVNTHPALQGCAMFGLQTEIFPVWKVETEPGRYLYSPYPQPGKQFVVLTPTYHDHRVRKPLLTWWVERPSAEDRLASEQLHLALWRRPVVPVRNPQLDNPGTQQV